MLARLRPGFTVLALALLSASVGCSGGSFESPEACFQSIRVAAHNKDMQGIVNCLTDESQEALAGMLVMAGGMVSRMPSGMAPLAGAAGSDEAKQAATTIKGVLKKHGVSDEELETRTANPLLLASAAGIRELSSLVSDKQAFIADMYAALQTMGQGAQFGAQFEEQIAGELKDVKVDGDQATAKVVTASGEEPLMFRKTPTGWKLHIDLSNVGPPA